MRGLDSDKSWGLLMKSFAPAGNAQLGVRLRGERQNQADPYMEASHLHVGALLTPFKVEGSILL